MFRTIMVAAMALSATTLRVGPRSPNLRFTAHYDGRGAEGIDDIWRGTLDRPDAGVIQIRIETTPSGISHGFVFVSHDSLSRSFGATVTGRIDGATAHLTGPIDVGKTAGATIDLTMHAGHGTIRVERLTASVY
ncbi:MAG TPA: hypothetical protein VKT80_05390 [Chloroflexota bacterium]|nr:hypothetical protein [Chloroflexota bacterium]